MNKLFQLSYLLLAVSVGCKKQNQNETDNPAPEKKWTVTTIAGDGRASFVDGPALTAEFNSPQDVAVAVDGTVYVTDMYNFRIRKIENNHVSTFAGSDSGFVNANGTAARFGNPYSIAMGPNGNLFVSDALDEHIRKISRGGDVSTYTANFNEFPPFFILVQGMAMDAQGDLIVADTYNQRIRKISASTDVTTIAGNDTAGFRDGIGASAQFNYPSGIAMDRRGNLFVPDPYNFRIRKITPTGEVTTFAGTGVFGFKDGDESVAQFQFPVDIVIDNQDNLYVADECRIRKITPQGFVSTIAGSTRGLKDGDGDTALFSFPSGLGIDADGNIYVADTFNNCIRKIKPD